MADILERGNIYFLYRPRVGEEAPEGKEDLQRFFVVLQADAPRRFRALVVGRKRLPDPARHERHWAFVDRVGQRAEDIEDALEAETYETKTRGERELPAARPAGEGRYVIARHEDHTHLAYELELPHRPGNVQHELEIEPAASYVITVKNPEAGTPPGAGLRPREKAAFPRELQNRFRGRRFADVDPPDFLDHEGAEIRLVGAHTHPEEEMGLRIDAERETAATAEIFRELKVEREQHPFEPLLRGEWR
jgi:hypothetical protein